MRIKPRLTEINQKNFFANKIKWELNQVNQNKQREFKPSRIKWGSN